MDHCDAPSVSVTTGCVRLQIINLGKRLTDTATLEVDWPKETEQGKWLLYLTKIRSTGVERVECTPKSEVNPLKLVSESFHRCSVQNVVRHFFDAVMHKDNDGQFCFGII